MNTLVIFTGTKHVSSMVDTIKETYDLHEKPKIVWASFSRTYDTMLELVKKSGMNVSRFTFIDGITSSVVENPQSKKNCIYIPKPRGKESLESNFLNVLMHAKMDFLFLDSISILAIYSSKKEVQHFIKTVNSYLSRNGIDSAFFCVSPDGSDIYRGWKKQFDSIVENEDGKNESLAEALELLNVGLDALNKGDNDGAVHAHVKLKFLYKFLPRTAKRQIGPLCRGFHDKLAGELGMTISPFAEDEQSPLVTYLRPFVQPIRFFIERLFH